jgi:diguanylate cyclase (GGDEF)-like protein
MSEVLGPVVTNRSLSPWIKEVGPLPIVFVLCAVEAQRHWNQPAMWAYLASSALVAFTWLGVMAGKSWATRYRSQIIDGTILILIACSVVFLSVESVINSLALANTLLFWSPLICLWWGASRRDRDWLTLLYFFLLYGLPLYVASQKPGVLHFEEMLLGALILLVARQLTHERPAGGNANRAARTTQDLLTGLISAECFEAELAMIASVSDRYRCPYSLIACTPDKPGKGTGQTIAALGEDMLQTVVSLIVDRVRQSDTICRWEQDVFFILLPNTCSPDAVQVAQGLHAAFPERAQSGMPPITCSLGIATHHFGDDPMHTFAKAEQAMQASVEAGGNRMTVAEPIA